MAFKVPARRVDQSALKVNQAFVLVLLALGLVLNSLPMIGIVALVLLVGTASPDLALFHIFYRDGLRPARIVKPHVIIDNPEPHSFAQGFGGTLVTLGLIAQMLDYNLLGVALIGFVALLALTYLLLNFCGGCFIYYQLNRLGIPGFRHSPIRVRQ